MPIGHEIPIVGVQEGQDPPEYTSGLTATFTGDISMTEHTGFGAVDRQNFPQDVTPAPGLTTQDAVDADLG